MSRAPKKDTPPCGLSELPPELPDVAAVDAKPTDRAEHASSAILPTAMRRGRGVLSNAAGRYEATQTAVTDDGWNSVLEGAAAIPTRLIRDASKTIVTRNQSPDISFDRSINPYRGCEHGCTYCFARPTHTYLGYSAGLDFETQIHFKPDAAALLTKELAKPAYKPATIALGTNTDPYQPVERQCEITREILQVLLAHRHPVTIVTKSALVTRDIDLLQQFARQGLAKVALSVTTLDRRLARTMEPRCSTPARRIEAIRELTQAGIPTAIMAAPVIPGLTDHELERILSAAARAGAQQAGYILLRLPLEVRDLFVEWLQKAAPDRADRVMSLVRQMRGGKDYDADFHQRMRGSGPVAEMIKARFALAARRLNLAIGNSGHVNLRTDLFAVPTDQGELFTARD